MVLEMLRQGLAPLANVQTANDGADAMPQGHRRSPT